MLYSDINQYRPTVKPMVEDIESVYQSITTILSTMIGERLFNREFGSNLPYLLMDPVDDITAAKIYHSIITAVERWEPRALLKYGMTEIIPYPDEHKYDCILVFEIYGFDGQTFEYRGVLEKH